MAPRHLNTYKKLASRKGFMDPLEYIWRRYECERKRRNHDQALDLAMFLVPFGHSKRGRDAAEAPPAAPTVFVLK